MMIQRSKNQGFTIVELLIVIVVIGILAAISIVSYNGITRRATIAAMKSELITAGKQLSNDNTISGNYPASQSTANQGRGLSAGSGRTFQYTGTNTTFCLTITSTVQPDLVYSIDQTGEVKETPCPGHTGGPVVVTNAACFAFSAGSITNYYDNEGNNGANPACPRTVVIPTTISSTSVTTISSNAFAYKQLTGVTLPSTATTIGDFAFRDNVLTSVTIPAPVTSIGVGAFYGNQLASVALPSTLTIIYDGAFEANQLTSLTIPSSVTTIGSDAFMGNLITSLVIPSSMNTINSSAFRNNKITSLTLPSSVTAIGVYAFGGNLLTTVTIPPTVSLINSYAFAGNQLTAVTVSSSATLGTQPFGVGVTVSYY